MTSQIIVSIKQALPAILGFMKMKDSPMTSRNESHGKEGELDLSTLDMGGYLDSGKTFRALQSRCLVTRLSRDSDGTCL